DVANAPVHLPVEGGEELGGRPGGGECSVEVPEPGSLLELRGLTDQKGRQRVPELGRIRDRDRLRDLVQQEVEGVDGPDLQSKLDLDLERLHPGVAPEGNSSDPV